MKPFISTLSELKENRLEIIEQINIEGDKNIDVKSVMVYIAQMVTASNFSKMDLDIYEVIEKCVAAVKAMPTQEDKEATIIINNMADNQIKTNKMLLSN